MTLLRRAPLVLAVLLSACTMKSQEAPPLAGPSEYAQSLAITVSPDVLALDGASQSVITILARDASAQPIRSLALRAEIEVAGARADFGSLSARNLVTGADGRASLVYTAPMAPAVAVDDFTIVDIVIVPVGTDFNNSTSRTVAIRLVPPNVVIPRDGLNPYFSVSTTSPQDNQPVQFQACNDPANPCSPQNNPIVRYDWDFGDGRRGSGRIVTHDYNTPGTYFATLTISDQYGRSASASQTITVSAGTNPTAAFVISPTDPVPGQQVNFNASGSTPAPGRRIVSYTWDFGDGGSAGSGVIVSRTYNSEGTFTVTLTVVDDLGRRGTVSQTVPVKIPETTLVPRTGGARP